MTGQEFTHKLSVMLLSGDIDSAESLIREFSIHLEAGEEQRLETGRKLLSDVRSTVSEIDAAGCKPLLLSPFENNQATQTTCFADILDGQAGLYRFGECVDRPSDFESIFGWLDQKTRSILVDRGFDAPINSRRDSRFRVLEDV